MSQYTIVRGEDRTLILRMIFRESKEPFDLVNWSKITVQFRKGDRSVLEKDSDVQGQLAASVIYETVTYTADTLGTTGNSISLVFDGIDNIDTVVNAWNAANPVNTVSHNGTGTVVPTASTENLVGGDAGYQDVEVINTTLGKVSVNLNDTETSELKSGGSQSFKVIVDKGVHPNGDRRIVLFDSKLNVEDVSF